MEDIANVVMFVAPEIANYTGTAVWEAAKAIAGAKPLSVEGVLPLLAVGGEITRDTLVFRKSNAEFWADIFWYYRVSVGSEKRFVLLASCRMPVEVTFSIALTHGEFSNKRIEFVNGEWRIFDLEDRKYDTPLQYEEQDAEWDVC